MTFKDKKTEKEYMKNYYKNNKEKLDLKAKEYKKEERVIELRRKYNLNWKNKNKKSIQEHHKKYSKKYKSKPENLIKIKAQIIAEKILIPNGKLCQKCNLKKVTLRHHNDYNKPKEIIYLCKPCHYKVHNK